jgi:CDP-diglyceride synthetase
LWVFLPILGSFLAHAPVLKLDLLRSLARPIDGGATFRGRRIFGDNKTWRGAVVMFAGVLAATIVLFQVPAWVARIPPELRDAGPVAHGTLLGLGVVVGELPNSFFKRQIGIAPGSQRRSLAGVAVSVVDQGDFVLGAWVSLAPIWRMSVAQAAIAFAGVVAAHLVVNVIGWAIGARKTLL